MNLSRRKLFTGIAALIAAPAIVRVASIMPVRSLPPDLDGTFDYLDLDGVRSAWSFSDMVTLTLRAHRPQLITNVTQTMRCSRA